MPGPPRPDREIDARDRPGVPLSTVCDVWAPVYRQITLLEPLRPALLNADSAASVTAYDSLRAGFEDYLKQRRRRTDRSSSSGTPRVPRCSSALLQHLVDNNPNCAQAPRARDHPRRERRRARPARSPAAASPTSPCAARRGEAGCVDRLLELPQPASRPRFFGRPGSGCLGAGRPDGDSPGAGRLRQSRGDRRRRPPARAVLPLRGHSDSLGRVPATLLRALQTAGGTTWLQVTKVSGPSDPRPVVTEKDGPDWGYHDYDVNLALGNLLADTAAAEATS